MKIRKTFLLEEETVILIEEIAKLLKWNKSLIVNEAIKKLAKEIK